MNSSVGISWGAHRASSNPLSPTKTVAPGVRCGGDHGRQLPHRRIGDRGEGGESRHPDREDHPHHHGHAGQHQTRPVAGGERSTGGRSGGAPTAACPPRSAPPPAPPPPTPAGSRRPRPPPGRPTPPSPPSRPAPGVPRAVANRARLRMPATTSGHRQCHHRHGGRHRQGGTGRRAAEEGAHHLGGPPDQDPLDGHQGPEGLTQRLARVVRREEPLDQREVPRVVGQLLDDRRGPHDHQDDRSGHRPSDRPPPAGPSAPPPGRPTVARQGGHPPGHGRHQDGAPPPAGTRCWSGR